MKIQTKNINKSLNKTFLSQNPFKHEITLFKKNFADLLKSINPKDSEETLKDFINRFLNDTYYKNKYTIKENVNNIDLIIKTGNKENGKIGVIIETKSIKNKPEMITVDDINKKALHELVVYYMEERFINNNLEIKHLIITNSSHWFIFDAQEFERIFVKTRHGKSLQENYKKWNAGKLVSKNKDWFYNEIISKFIEYSDDTINCTYFELPTLIKLDKFTDQNLIELYKIFSPIHLLKLSLQNDSNSLNTYFYNELLHIIGLHEIKRQKVRKIERLPQDQRNNGSLIENTINILQTNEVLYNLKEPETYGETKEKQLFSIALELCIIWLNRILFLKLLEAQLLKYNNSNKDYLFLSIKKIKDFEQLSELFFEVLAIKPEERERNLQDKYSYIPYLNSSLFEHSKTEREAIKISQLKSHKEIEISTNTVLKNKKGKKLTGTKPILNYIFEFLDSYNFASDHKVEIQETNKTIINSAVLGLIFEKINGYKEGSHFTPGFITMYMTREILRKAVINKFNENFEKVETWTDLYNKIDKISIPEANKIINSIKICDPSVGSGHFLVSSLNEMISIKSDLKILTDEKGRILRDTEIEVINDELFITTDGIPFSYNYKNTESQRIQKTLFNEKQTIIENCLFGVDINSKSVNISRLRLWIELLKHTYYINPKMKNDRQLQTLPNIDINIKIGNSLISHFALNGNGYENGKQQSLKIYTKKYKQVVADYKNTNDREAKRTLERFITEQKENFSRTVNPNDENIKKIRKIESKMGEMPMFFSRDDQKQWQQKVKQLQKELDELQKIYNDKLKTVYNQAFEWRFEFPEVLDENGKFIGFDVVIGNPPYIKEMNAKEIFMPIRKSGLWNNYIQGKMDLWYFFLHKAFDITSKTGLISYITNSYWVKSSGSKKLIQRIYKNKSLNEIINFNDLPIFEKVVGKHMIHSYEKNNNKQIVKYRNINDISELEKIENLSVSELKFSEMVKETFINIYSEQNIELTCEYKTLGELYNVSQGVVEAPDKINKTTGVFVISENEYEQLNLTKDEKKVVKKYLNTSDINKFIINWNKQYLLFTDKINRSRIAKNELPNIKKHLDKFTDNITSSNKPYGIHRDRSSKINPFEQNKLICKGMFKEPEFVYDENCYYVGFSFSVIWQLNNDYNLKYLLGILNSSFAKHWFYANGKKRGIGVDIGVRKFREFPVPKATKQEQQKIINIVNKISKQTTQNKKINNQMKQLDNAIYILYNFSKDKIIEIEKE